MRTRLVLIVAGLGLLLSAGPALAHHAFAAEYDAKKPIKLTGAVTKLEWLNPHTWFYIDVKDDTGKVTNWGFEMGSPNILLRAGWTRNSMKPGDVVTVEGSRAKDGSNNGNVKVVTLVSTGQRLFAGSSQEQQ
jgi:DNA/RNA endonuclease YhcR with UshA esterase domain